MAGWGVEEADALAVGTRVQRCHSPYGKRVSSRLRGVDRQAQEEELVGVQPME